MSTPAGSATGPVITPDPRTAFLAVQHPGEGGTFEAPLCMPVGRFVDLPLRRTR